MVDSTDRSQALMNGKQWVVSVHPLVKERQLFIKDHRKVCSGKVCVEKKWHKQKSGARKTEK